jgi:hypothetical protein
MFVITQRGVIIGINSFTSRDAAELQIERFRSMEDFSAYNVQELYPVSLAIVSNWVIRDMEKSHDGAI